MNAITNTVELAIKRLARQYRDKPGIEGLLTMMVQGFQDLEDAGQALPAAMDTIDGAAGVQLDGLGKLLTQPREGRIDSVYRLWLKARLQRSRRSGTVPDVIVILALLAPEGALIKISPRFPAGFLAELLAVAVPNVDAVEIGKILHLSTGGGIESQLIWSPALEAGTLVCPSIFGTLHDDLAGGELGFQLDMHAGAFPSIGDFDHGVTILLVGSLDHQEQYMGYDGFTPGSPATMSIDGYGSITVPHLAGELVYIFGAADPGLGLGDPDNPDAGGVIGGAY